MQIWMDGWMDGHRNIEKEIDLKNWEDCEIGKPECESRPAAELQEGSLTALRQQPSLLEKIGSVFCEDLQCIH